jgi:hypothetical protein
VLHRMSLILILTGHFKEKLIVLIRAIFERKVINVPVNLKLQLVNIQG